MRTGDCAVSGQVPEPAARRRVMVRRLVLAGFAAAGSAVFAAGTAAADEPASTGLLSLGDHAGALGGVLGEADGPALDAVLGDVDVADVSSALVDVESVPGLDLITGTDAGADRPVGGSAGGVEADNGTDGAKAGGTPERSSADGPSDPTADSDGAGRASDRDHGESSRGAEPDASRDVAPSASEAVSHAGALRELAGGLAGTVGGTVGAAMPVFDTAAAVSAPVLSVVDPVVTTAASVLQPALQTVEPVVDTALAVTAPVVRPLAPVVTTIVPVLDTITPLISTVMPGMDVLGPAAGGLLPAPAGPMHPADGPWLASFGDATAVTPPPALTPGVEATTRGGSTAPQISLETADQPRVIAVQVPEGERPDRLSTPLTGLPGLSLGALSATASADQTVPTSSALLPEEAAQRARFVSAAARASGVDGWSQREATRPSVSPD